MARLIAIVDQGTNTSILTVAKIDLVTNSFTVIHDEVTITRLGEGIHNNTKFLDHAMKRTVETLKRYGNIARQLECDDYHLFGTAACRNATNTQDFVDLCATEDIPFEIHIISGEREAELIFNASTKDFTNVKTPRVILDIGGGSTELIIENEQHERHLKSFPFGSVKLTEQFIKSDPPKPEEIENLKNFVSNQINAWPHPKVSHMIATAGTPTTLCALSKKLDQYDPEQVHGQFMSQDQLNVILNQLISETFEKRIKHPCLPEKRADVIIAGSIILRTIVDQLNCDGFYVSDQGLRYGVLYWFLENKNFPIED